MKTISAAEARKSICRLLDDVNRSHEPLQIAGRRGKVVLVSDEDWRSIQETLCLLSIPRMRRSIRNGMKAPVTTCRKNPGW